MMPLEHNECDYRASELRGMLRSSDALGGDELRATVADAARTLEAAHERIAALEAALRDLLPYARTCVPNPMDVGERNVIGRAEDLLDFSGAPDTGDAP